MKLTPEYIVKNVLQQLYPIQVILTITIETPSLQNQKIPTLFQ